MQMLRAFWAGLGRIAQIAITIAGLLLAAVLGLALALAFSGGSSKAAATVTTTTASTTTTTATAPPSTVTTTAPVTTTVATPVPVTTTAPVATTVPATTATVVTPTGTTTAVITPAAPATTGSTSSTATPGTVSTGGGSMTGGSTAATGSSNPCETGQQPSSHGLVTIIHLDGPFTDGGTTGIEVTVCKVSGDPVVEPNLKIGQSFDGRPFEDFAVLHLPSGVYSFMDKHMNLFNLPTMQTGDSYTVAGTIDVPDRGDKPAANFCVSAAVEMVGTTPTYNSKGYPIPNWTDPVAQQCVRYTVQ